MESCGLQALITKVVSEFWAGGGVILDKYATGDGAGGGGHVAGVVSLFIPSFQLLVGLSLVEEAESS